MLPRVGVGIVGAKFAAGFHLESWKRVPGVEVVIDGVTSLNKEIAEAFGRQHKIDVYTSLEGMLGRGGIGIIDLCTPDYAHEELAIAAAQAGKHVVVEKLLTGYFSSKSKRSSGAVISVRINQ